MPSSIIDPVEQNYWNELVNRREELNKEGQRVHNYRMSVQEVPIVSATVSVKGKEYPIWLLGSEAYCYAPGLSEEFENGFGRSEGEKQQALANFIMKLSTSCSLTELLKYASY